LYEGAHVAQSHKVSRTTKAEQPASGKPLLVLYGSNAGTCEGLAQKLGQSAGSHGYAATIIPLDDGIDAIRKEVPVVIVTASYEGNPPDNADAFVGWLKGVDTEKLKDVQFAVFGCGHRDWVATYQKVPKLVESEMLARGARRITERGESDVAQGRVFDDFDAWQDEQLWRVLAADSEVSQTSDALDMEMDDNARASHLRHNVQNAQVLRNDVLTPSGVPEKRVTEFHLPDGMPYEAGDYLALLPVSNIQTISRVLRRFGIPWDATMTLRKGAHTTIPTEIPMSITTVLGSYVELNSSASRKNIATLNKYTKDEALDEKVLDHPQPPSILQLLEKYPEIDLPFPVFLAMLTPMRIRQYSISSSALRDATKARIVYSVVNADPNYLGVATNYLKSLSAGSTVQVMIKKSHASFHLPDDLKTPILMLCAGTGLAPFLGFIEERAARIAASGQAAGDFGEAVLFVGCRDPEQDRLYADDLDRWQREGVVKVYYAFSRRPEKSAGCKYAQDRLWLERDEASRLFADGARAYICGSSALGKGIADVVAKIAVAEAKKKSKELTLEDGLKWWEGLRGERYAVDVFD
jgi:cytochrome P450/NADPH-cytochrome P450 reductase